jgi:hypothetical protein
MMTKWDTIQADVADAYVYVDEEEAYNKALTEGLVDFGSDDDELHKSLTLDWND